MNKILIVLLNLFLLPDVVLASTINYDNVCNNSGVGNVMIIVGNIISVVKWIVPLIIIALGMVDFGKVVISSDDSAINKATTTLIRRIVAGVVVFFVPTLIGACTKLLLEFDILGEGNQFATCTNCMFNVADCKEAVRLLEEQEAAIRQQEKEEYEKLKEELRQKAPTEIGYYPIVPFGEHELYTGLKFYKGDSLDNLLKKNGSSAEKLDRKIKAAVEYYGVGTRKATVAAAITLIGSVAETGYQLPYQWGGKWAKIGVNPSWGTYKHPSSCNEYYFDTQEEIDSCIARNQYWAMDCSGFVNWAVIQGVQEVRSQSSTNGGTRVNLNSSTADYAVCNIGDALGTPGHIVLVVGLDDENKRYIIAEESSGLEIDSVPYSGSKGEGYYCIQIDDYID